MSVVLSVCLPVIGPGLSSTSPDKSSSNLKWGGGYTLSQVFIVNPDLNQLSVIVSVHCTLDHEQWVTIPTLSDNDIHELCAIKMGAFHDQDHDYHSDSIQLSRCKYKPMVVLYIMKELKITTLVVLYQSYHYRLQCNALWWCESAQRVTIPQPHSCINTSSYNIYNQRSYLLKVDYIPSILL